MYLKCVKLIFSPFRIGRTETGTTLIYYMKDFVAMYFVLIDKINEYRFTQNLLYIYMSLLFFQCKNAIFHTPKTIAKHVQ